MFGQESSCVQFLCILWKELRDKSGYHTLSLETYSTLLDFLANSEPL